MKRFILLGFLGAFLCLVARTARAEGDEDKWPVMNDDPDKVAPATVAKPDETPITTAPVEVPTPPPSPTPAPVGPAPVAAGTPPTTGMERSAAGVPAESPQPASASAGPATLPAPSPSSTGSSVAAPSPVSAIKAVTAPSPSLQPVAAPLSAPAATTTAVVPPSPSAPESGARSESVPDLSTQSSVTEHADDDERSLMAFSARVDAGYIQGNTVTQGFTIPSLRLSAHGDVTDVISYRLSFGETREFSTALLPQILPMEAYVAFGHEPDKDSSSARLTWRVGMFTPTLNPWWSPDLAYLNIPSYQQTQYALLLGPDIGTEVSFYPFGQSLQLTMGYFNGNGNYGLNVNDAKALTFFLKETIPAGRGRFVTGAGIYYQGQSLLGDDNYKSNWVGDAYAGWEVGPLTLSLDLLGGTLTDSMGNSYPLGGAALTSIDFTHWLGLFARAEYLVHSPNDNGTLEHGQIGPEIRLSDAVKAFVTYDYQQSDVAGVENSLQILLRLVI